MTIHHIFHHILSTVLQVQYNKAFIRFILFDREMMILNMFQNKN